MACNPDVFRYEAVSAGACTGDFTDRPAYCARSLCVINAGGYTVLVCNRQLGQLSLASLAVAVSNRVPAVAGVKAEMAGNTV